jgi:hypothetical protein
LLEETALGSASGTGVSRTRHMAPRAIDAKAAERCASSVGAKQKGKEPPASHAPVTDVALSSFPHSATPVVCAASMRRPRAPDNRNAQAGVIVFAGPEKAPIAAPCPHVAIRSTGAGSRCARDGVTVVTGTVCQGAPKSAPVSGVEKCASDRG